MMTSEAIRKLWSDEGLTRFVRKQVSRHFSNHEDRDEVMNTVWLKCAEYGEGASADEIRVIAYRTIRAIYMRIYRRRRRNAEQLGASTRRVAP